MRFRRLALLDFYDDPQSELFAADGRGSHVSAITGLIGEDLILGLLLHYWKSQGDSARVISYQCTQGTIKGVRLDAWVIKNDGELFQVEVKNWSAHSRDGYRLPADSSQEEVAAFAAKWWNRYLASDKTVPAEFRKVLVPMKRPAGYDGFTLSKLLCFWFPVRGPEQQPYCVMQLSSDSVHVFSASAYLRSLSVEQLELEMPRVEARLALLGALRFDDDA